MIHIIHTYSTKTINNVLMVLKQSFFRSNKEEQEEQIDPDSWCDEFS